MQACGACDVVRAGAGLLVVEFDAHCATSLNHLCASVIDGINMLFSVLDDYTKALDIGTLGICGELVDFFTVEVGVDVEDARGEILSSINDFFVFAVGRRNDFLGRFFVCGINKIAVEFEVIAEVVEVFRELIVVVCASLCAADGGGSQACASDSDGDCSEFIHVVSFLTGGRRTIVKSARKDNPVRFSYYCILWEIVKSATDDRNDNKIKPPV